MRIILYLIALTFVVAQDDIIVNIDASSYNNWVYFSFEQASVVEIDNPENSLDWDVAFQRKHIRTNSGLSGIENGGAYVDSSSTWIDTWDTTSSVPDDANYMVDEMLNDFYDPLTHLFGQGIKNPALNQIGHGTGISAGASPVQSLMSIS